MTSNVGIFSHMHGAVSAWLRRAPAPLFVAALMLASFAGGMYVDRYKVFPYALLSAAHKTFATAVEANRPDPYPDSLGFADVPPEQAAARRFEFIGSDRLADPILVPGGWGQFREHCPDHVGCIAVEYAGRGEVRHAWPYRSEELAKWLEKEEFTRDFPYEYPLGFSFSGHVKVHAVSRYANGDLLAVFTFFHAHPSGGGVARIDRTGKPVWYRPDYSHHDPHLTDGEVVLVPGTRISKPGSYPPEDAIAQGGIERPIVMSCPEWYQDLVNVIDTGEVKEISVFDAIIESSYTSLLHYANPCDPTHVNSVHLLGEDAAGRGLEPGDLVVSIRNLHAFAILDRDTHRLKRLVRGGFMMQHSVLHLEGSRFLLFDNRGGRTADGARMVSRLLMVDAASGEETAIFPNHRTPGHLRYMFSHVRGGVAISPDRRRVMVTFSEEGKAVEVRIADGAVLVVFDSIHDVSQLDKFPEERATRTVRTRLYGVRYGGEG